MEKIDTAGMGIVPGMVPPCCLCGLNLNGKHSIITLTTNKDYTICYDCYSEHEDDLIACGICYRVTIKSKTEPVLMLYPWGDERESNRVVEACEHCAKEKYHCLSSPGVEYVVRDEDRPRYAALANEKIKEYKNICKGDNNAKKRRVTKRNGRKIRYVAGRKFRHIRR